MVTINGMVLDLAAQSRLARIREHNEQYGSGGITVDYRTAPRGVLEETRRQIRAVLEDPRFPNERVRHEEAMRIAREGQQRHNEVSRQAQEAYRQERDRLERQAKAAQPKAPLTTNQILEREAALRRLERRWQRSPEAIPSLYRRAVAEGDQTTVELMEDNAREFITDQAKRMEFSDLTREQKAARMTPQQLAAVEQAERLAKEEGAILGGIAHQRHTFVGEMDKLREGRKMLGQQFTDTRRNELAGVGGRDGQ